MSKKFKAKILGVTTIKCELEKKENGYKVTNAREEGFNAFKLNLFGLNIGLGPYDFRYFVEKTIPSKGGTNTFKIYCNYKFLFLIIPISFSKKIGEYEPEFWVL